MPQGSGNDLLCPSPAAGLHDPSAIAGHLPGKCAKEDAARGMLVLAIYLISNYSSCRIAQVLGLPV